MFNALKAAWNITVYYKAVPNNILIRSEQFTVTWKIFWYDYMRQFKRFPRLSIPAGSKMSLLSKWRRKYLFSRYLGGVVCLPVDKVTAGQHLNEFYCQKTDITLSNCGTLIEKGYLLLFSRCNLGKKIHTRNCPVIDTQQSHLAAVQGKKLDTNNGKTLPQAVKAKHL